MMFVGPDACLHAAIAVCSLVGLALAGVGALIFQEIQFRKLDRRYAAIMARRAAK